MKDQARTLLANDAMVFKHLIVPFDFGDPSRHALQLAVQLAKRYRAALTIVLAWELPSLAYSGVELAAVEPFTSIHADAQRDLDALLAEVRKELPEAQALLRRGSPWRQVVAAIEETKADLVVMGTAGRRGLARAILGSVTEKVVRMSPVPVLTVDASGKDVATPLQLRSILVPMDFGEPSSQALRVAVDLAKQFRSSLTLMHTWEIPAYVYAGLEVPVADFFHPAKDAAQQHLDAAVAEARMDIPEARGILRTGTPWREVLATIEETAPDLVVMGTHGRRGLTRALLGSVTEKIVRTSPAPVLTVGAQPER